MSSEGGPEPGWYVDPHGRHAHRWWDGRTWTDQVADDGRTTVDAPDAAAPPAEDAGGGHLSVGLLAVVVVLLAAAGILAAVAFGGDDGDSTASSASSSSDEGEEESEDDGDDGLVSEGAISGDQRAVVEGIDLEAGDAVRVVVDSDDLDATVQLAVEADALTDGFRGLLASGGDQDLVEERLARQAEILVGNISDGVSDEVIDFEDLEAMTDLLGDRVEGYDDAGYAFLGTDRSGSGEPEGLQFVAPVDGQYALVVSGYTGSEGDYEATVEVVGNDDTGLDDDEIDYLDYLALYAEHLDAFCDDDFYAGDPDDATNYGPTLCDPDELEGTLSGEFNGDFTNDFGGGEAG